MLSELNKTLIIIPLILGLIGVVSLYSVAGGSFQPWALTHIIRLILCFGIYIGISFIPAKFFYNTAYIFFAAGLVMLLLVLLIGQTGMGAKRWLSFANQTLQPSEFIKISLILAVARVLKDFSYESIKSYILLSLVVIVSLIPVLLVLIQPDLGTAVILLLSLVMLLFISGIRLWKLGLVFLSIVFSFPLIWLNLQDYQKHRILTFLEPENDPLGSGYHIIQSKIALGSGGLTGRGFLAGSQTQLSFLPETHTDFIFTVVGEEFGLVGSVIVICLWCLMSYRCFQIGIKAKNLFNQRAALGLAFIIFIYYFINNAMVSGLLPVVGIPMPLVSYGGSSMLSFFVMLGILQSINYSNKIYG